MLDPEVDLTFAAIIVTGAGERQDMNLKSLHRPYKSHIQRIDEMAAGDKSHVKTASKGIV